MTDDRLGERVLVSEIEPNLPHPQDPWSDAPTVDTPFSASQPAHTSRHPLGVETSYDPRGTLPDPLSRAKEEREHRTSPAPQQAPVAQGTRPVPTSPMTSSESSTLKKFREVFGLKRVDVVPVTISRRDPHNPEVNIDLVFGLRGINYDDYQWVLEKTREMIQDPALANFAWKAAFVSMGVASIDGEPIYQVFGIKPESADHVRDPMYPHMGLRFQAASALCEEIRTSLFDLVENLYVAYEEKVDTKYLPVSKKNKEKEQEEPSLPLPLTDSVR